MHALAVYGLGLALSLGAMTAVWLLSLARRDASIVDVYWGIGFVPLVALYVAFGEAPIGRQAFVLGLIAVWGLRLAGYLYLRKRGEGEDYRYQAWRKRAGSRFWWVSFLQVFMLQGLVMWVVSAPLLAIAVAPGDDVPALHIAGGFVWIVGFLFEAVGDYQLARFKANPANKGRVMRQGLWRYTRHPNYFGDATMWWGFYIIAAGVENGYWTFFSPLLMTTLLLRVSGVALLERRQTATKPEYKDYVESTSPFVPWFPKKGPVNG